MFCPTADIKFPPSQAVYLVPIEAVAEFEGRLRLEPPRNNQRQRIRFAENYEIDRWTIDSLREIAETAERQSDDALSVA